MNPSTSTFALALVAALALAGCDRPAPEVTPPPATVIVPGPAGPAGPAGNTGAQGQPGATGTQGQPGDTGTQGAQGNDGSNGATGKTGGDTTVIVVQPPASAPHD